MEYYVFVVFLSGSPAVGLSEQQRTGFAGLAHGSK